MWGRRHLGLVLKDAKETEEAKEAKEAEEAEEAKDAKKAKEAKPKEGFLGFLGLHSGREYTWLSRTPAAEQQPLPMIFRKTWDVLKARRRFWMTVSRFEAVFGAVLGLS